MSDGFDISKITGSANQIAIDVDNSNVKDGKLSKAEYSIFLTECENKGIDITQEDWYSNCVDFFTKNVDKLNDKLKLNKQEPAAQDATKVIPNQEVQLMKEGKLDKVNETKHNSFLKPLKLSENSNIRTNYIWSEKAFTTVLDEMLNAKRYKGKFSKSVLQKKAKSFIEAGKKYNIDPRFLVAISMCESKRGTSEIAISKNNIGGIKIDGKFYKFSTVEESIDSVAQTINKRYNEGFTTPAKVAKSGKYCKKEASTRWLSDVSSYFNFFNKYYKDEQ